ncbi:LOW QUALITY PROTEIN: MLO-like protein 12 [Alnus glutinosa]|uniref:LOW QUALITY PROTEIN: MLO-like protein 12 n=1 Tax=Alnus glutinosa TaxID=3517 RepID=UPI002D76FC3A|nr:LOW QUALITY PROTEIN: MLO-like protein 12 [Alnus glutinosa]
MAKAEKERTMEETSTWAVAAVCFVLLAISIFIEYIIHAIGKWLKDKQKRPLYEALEKIKAELMLLGFISLLLTVLQDPISDICIPKSVGATWHPCKNVKSGTTKKDPKDSENSTHGRKLLQFLDSNFSARRKLATKGDYKCTRKGKVAFMSAYAIHQLHVFIFVLAVSHVVFCILTLALGRIKMKGWKVWENETRTPEYRYQNDRERFRFARETSFGRRHLDYWSKSTFSLWVVCFFRQVFRSVTKVDYITLRYGFIMAHLAPDNETTFDFQKYIKRSLEEDFKYVVGISKVIWGFAVLSLLSNVHGWRSHLWLPFLPLIVLLLVGTKLLQVNITKMGLRIQERADVIKGMPVVQPGDDLFWLGRPRFLLLLINFVLFQNAFQLAFLAWSVFEFGKNSCFHERSEYIFIRLSMGVIIQVLCSYVTFPLYALVTQMGTSMKPTIFNDRVATALRS